MSKQAKKLDMDEVKLVLDLRKKRNKSLKNKEKPCDLRPNETKETCKNCPEKIKDECLRCGAVRKMIHENEKRSRDEAREKKRKEKFTSQEAVSEETPSYPCEEMADACPDKDTCNYGEDCKWKP